MGNLKNFIKEYKEFIQNYIFPLIGHPFKNELFNEEKNELKDNGLIIKKENKKIMFNIPKNDNLIAVNLKNDISDDVINLINSICKQYGKVAIYSYVDDSKRQIELSKTEQERRYNYAVQLGICYWISTKGDKIEKLFSILENWSIKTYEGRKVTYSIIVDTDIEHVVAKNNFFEFLKDEYSATLTDPITSAFLVDIEGNLIKYVSIINEKRKNQIKNYKLTSNTPLRFANLIYKEVDGKKIGIFLLSNGDFIISKKKELLLIKRNGRWLNCQFNSFYNALLEFKITNKISKQLIKEIFLTTLDISFSHTGGLISVLVNNEFINGKEPIIDKFDQLNEKINDDDLKKIIKEHNELLNENEIDKEVFKRKVKKEIILNLIKDKKMKFVNIERKLRSELAALDGAFIINKKGNIISVGSIIQNDKGSSGGGRSAAAKKLSKNGMAIKISTDGYIETFVNGTKIYSIK